MANQTVYPYGTGGSLPSSIGIINDLTTGGADKALAAEQGKVLKTIIGGGEQLILSAELTHKEYAINGSGNWQEGTHVAVPVTPGEEIKLKAVSMTTDGGYCGFVTSVYDDGQTRSKNIGLTPEGAIFWQGGSENTYTVPKFAKYLILTTRTQSYQTEYSIGRTLPCNFMDREEGEELHQIFFPGYEETDLSELTDVALYPRSNQSPRIWLESGNHIACPVTPGTTILLNILWGNQNGCWYFFVDESYPSSLTVNKVIPLVGDLRWFTYPNKDGIVLTVPDGAAYLCMCSSSNYTAKWGLYVQQLVQDSGVLTPSDIVNDLSSGGTKKVLSAEQGKVLASMLLDDFPSALTKHEYIGAPVKVGNTHYVATQIVSTITSIACQGGACYGDYLFMFNENNTTCWIYNLSTNTLLQTYTIPSGQRGFVSSCHNNTVNFGTEKYDSGDPFPLIYLSTGYNYDGYSGALVYRIIATTENSVTTYSLSLVQTLKIPGTSWTEFIVGSDGDCYIKQELDGIHYYRMRMPTLSQGDYTFDLGDALETYSFTAQPSWYNGSSNQCHIYHNGKIYLVSGVPTSQSSLFICLDLATRRREVEIDLYNTLSLTSEPEALFIWRGHFCIAFRSNANVYALYFE